MAHIWKLCTGEEIIGNLKEKNELDGSITIDKPLQIIMGMGRDNKPMLSLFPYMMYADLSGGLTIKLDKIVFQVTPEIDLQNNYAQSIGGIVVPEKPPLKLIT
jgi:hypothetical protein